MLKARFPRRDVMGKAKLVAQGTWDPAGKSWRRASWMRLMGGGLDVVAHPHSRIAEHGRRERRIPDSTATRWRRKDGRGLDWEQEKAVGDCDGEESSPASGRQAADEAAQGQGALGDGNYGSQHRSGDDAARVLLTYLNAALRLPSTCMPAPCHLQIVYPCRVLVRLRLPDKSPPQARCLQGPSQAGPFLWDAGDDIDLGGGGLFGCLGLHRGRPSDRLFPSSSPRC